MEKEKLTAKEYLTAYGIQSSVDTDEYIDKTIAVNSEACCGLCCQECGACCRSM